TMQGGTLNGTANISLTGTSMTWTGGIIGGSGTLSIPSGTTVTVSGYPYLDSLQVANAGSIKFSGNYYMYMQNNAVLTNSGTLEFFGDSSIYVSGTVGTTSVVNTGTGTIKKTSGTSYSYFTVPLTMQSGSQFQVNSTTIYFGNITSTGGTMTIANG